MRQGARLSVAVAVIAAFAALGAQGASAASGEITKAVASPDWLSASFSGSVRGPECTLSASLPPTTFPGAIGPELPGTEPAPSCSWTAYLTVAPGSASEECDDSARSPSSLGADVVLAWTSGQRWSGVASFDVSGVALTGGKPQLACLLLVVKGWQYPVCVQIFPSPCPTYIVVGGSNTVDSALLSEESPPNSPPADVPPVEETPPAETPPTETPPIDEVPPEDTPPIDGVPPVEVPPVDESSPPSEAPALDDGASTVLPPREELAPPAARPPHKPKCKKEPHKAAGRMAQRCGKKRPGPRVHKGVPGI